VSRPRRSFAAPCQRVAAIALAALLVGCGEEGGDSGAGGGGAPPGAGGPPPATVRLEPVDLRVVQETREVVGSLRAKQRSQVAVVEPGRVVAVDFDEAQDVRAGDVLVRIDDRRLREEVAEVEADIAAAEASVAERRAEAERVRSDLESRLSAARRARGAVSELDLRQARTAVEVAEARVDAAEKQLAAVRTRLQGLRVRLDDLVVRAPFDGRITARTAELGEFLNPGDPVATIISDGVFEAVLDAPESLPKAAVIAASPQDVLVRLDSGDVLLDVSDVRVVGDVDPRSRRYQVVIDVTAPDNVRLAPGMSVTARLPASGEARRLVIPADAIRPGVSGPFVYLALGEEGELPSAVPQPVEVLFERGNDAVLVTPPGGPFQPGTPVVAEGAERIFMPGQPLQEAPPEPADPMTQPVDAAPATRPA